MAEFTGLSKAQARQLAERVLALSKADLVPEPDAARAVAQWRARLGEDAPVAVTSSATGC